LLRKSEQRVPNAPRPMMRSEKVTRITQSSMQWTAI